MRRFRSDIEGKRTRREVLRAEIANLADAFAQGHSSEALFEKLSRRERELQELEAALLSDREDAIQVKIDQLEKFIRDRFADLRQLSAKNCCKGRAG